MYITIYIYIYLITSKVSLVQPFFPHFRLVAKKHPKSPRTDRNPCRKEAELLQDSCPASRSHSLSEPLVFFVAAARFDLTVVSSSAQNVHVVYINAYIYIFIHTYTCCISGTNINVINMHRTVPEKSKRTGGNKIHWSWRSQKIYVLHTDENRPSPET